MKLSTRTRYGLRAMLELADGYGGEPRQLRKIAWNQGVSAKYLEHLMRALRQHRLVLSARGAAGGYTLAREPAAIKLSEVFEALDGRLELVHCVDYPMACSRSARCATRKLWERLAGAMWSVLEGTTLADLVELQGEQSENDAAAHNT